MLCVPSVALWGRPSSFEGHSFAKLSRSRLRMRAEQAARLKQ
ncbi:hypothetical protein FBZ98_10116 [Rhizobium sp. ERR 922]|nr:hypothetical protein FBZ98_10116 [Rhizobium sp. ERR 922]TWC03616.1 hypothetical protein FBZ97_10116 [Rhizobium sp. ERR 942]